MTTLIIVHTSHGCAGRCDARCYEAKDQACFCICNGKNHGMGLEQAITNTKEQAAAWITTYTKEHHLVDPIWEVPATKPVQLSLL